MWRCGRGTCGCRAAPGPAEAINERNAKASWQQKWCSQLGKPGEVSRHPLANPGTISLLSHRKSHCSTQVYIDYRVMIYRHCCYIYALRNIESIVHMATFSINRWVIYCVDDSSTRYIITIKIHSSCEIEDFIETRLCKLCVMLRTRVLRVGCPHDSIL